MFHSDDQFVLTYGDAFVDYIADDHSNQSFTMFLGGATVNVAAGIARLGVPSAFITITGGDETSAFVRNELMNEGVDLRYAILEESKRVSGVYVHLTEENDRVFAKYVDEAPDTQVKPEQLEEEAFQKASIFHMCSGTTFHPIALSTTREAVKLAKNHGTMVSMDANIRPLRWDSEEQCRTTIRSFFADADLLKLTEEELFFLTETKSMEEGLKELKEFQIPIILVTLGDHGTQVVLNGGESRHVPVDPVEPVDTTGAGDAFMAGILRHVHLNGMPKTEEALVECVSFGNKLGALAATKPGALTAMPRLHEIEEM